MRMVIEATRAIPRSTLISSRLRPLAPDRARTKAACGGCSSLTTVAGLMPTPGTARCRLAPDATDASSSSAVVPSWYPIAAISLPGHTIAATSASSASAARSTAPSAAEASESNEDTSARNSASCWVDQAAVECMSAYREDHERLVVEPAHPVRACDLPVGVKARYRRTAGIGRNPCDFRTDAVLSENLIGSTNDLLLVARETVCQQQHHAVATLDLDCRHAAGRRGTGGAQIVRCPGGHPGSHREALAAESGHDDAGVARTMGRDLSGSRAADQRHAPGALADLADDRGQVVGLGAEDDEQLGIGMEERSLRCLRSRLRLPTGSLPDPHPPRRLHNHFLSAACLVNNTLLLRRPFRRSWQRR